MRKPRRAKRLSRNHSQIELVRTAKADALDFVAAYMDRGQIDLGYTPDPRSWVLMGALAELASDAAAIRWPDLTDNARAAALRVSAQQLRRTAKRAVQQHEEGERS